MRISNKCYFGSVLIIRRIYFRIFHGWQCNDRVVFLPRKSSGLQMDCRRVTFVRKLAKKVFLNCRICKRLYLVKFRGLIIDGQAKLSLSQRQRLFGQKLRRKGIFPFRPISFVSSLINKTKLLVRIIAATRYTFSSLRVIEVLAAFICILN